MTDFKCPSCGRTNPTDSVWLEGDRLRKCDACATRISEEYAEVAREFRKRVAATRTVVPSTVRGRPTGTQLRGHQLVALARAWFPVHWPRFVELERAVLAQHAAGKTRISVDAHLHTIRDGTRKPVSNNLTAIMARIIVHRHPELKNAILIKRSALDSLPGDWIAQLNLPEAA